MIQRPIIFFGQNATLACDARCEKAWGVQIRPRAELSDDPDEFEWKGDSELGSAPIDPGTYEGGHAKPRTDSERLNKWCARQCERSCIVKPGEPIDLPDLTFRVDNKTP